MFYAPKPSRNPIAIKQRLAGSLLESRILLSATIQQQCQQMNLMTSFMSCNSHGTTVILFNGGLVTDCSSQTFPVLPVIYSLFLVCNIFFATFGHHTKLLYYRFSSHC